MARLLHELGKVELPSTGSLPHGCSKGMLYIYQLTIKEKLIRRNVNLIIMKYFFENMPFLTFSKAILAAIDTIVLRPFLLNRNH